MHHGRGAVLAVPGALRVLLRAPRRSRGRPGAEARDSHARRHLRQRRRAAARAAELPAEYQPRVRRADHPRHRTMRRHHAADRVGLHPVVAGTLAAPVGGSRGRGGRRDPRVGPAEPQGTRRDRHAVSAQAGDARGARGEERGGVARGRRALHLRRARRPSGCPSRSPSRDVKGRRRRRARRVRRDAGVHARVLPSSGLPEGWNDGLGG
mmetsp:Transcript_4203/g.19058  ORF Transcript_4203/g.19058 Transcript_4203/m.19058 type:complete len:209 (-) Transcript_4203:999-1625(-)